MNYELTKHAQKALEERGIQIEWLERTFRGVRHKFLIFNPANHAFESIKRKN